MKKMFAVLFLMLSFMFLSAQETDEEGRLIKYREKTVIDFEDVMLEGQIKKPSGSFLMDRTKTKFNSLINLKQDFNKELVKSVDLLN
ncbi:hypothetical protein J6Z19_06770 [bacterium]|nr:hypothetical protein [bacterium]